MEKVKKDLWEVVIKYPGTSRGIYDYPHKWDYGIDWVDARNESEARMKAERVANKLGGVVNKVSKWQGHNPKKKSRKLTRKQKKMGAGTIVLVAGVAAVCWFFLIRK